MSKSDLPKSLEEWRKAKPRDVVDVPPEVASKFTWSPEDIEVVTASALPARTITAASMLTKEEPRRYTLGVVYAKNELDSEKDFATPEELEAAAWEYLQKSRDVGVMHKDGTTGKGELVESYIYRGPRWETEDQVVEDGDWLAGAIWDEPTFKRILEGDLTGWSLEGEADVTTDQPKPKETLADALSASAKERVDRLEASYLREEASALTAHLEGQHDQKDHAGGGDSDKPSELTQQKMLENWRRMHGDKPVPKSQRGKFGDLVDQKTGMPLIAHLEGQHDQKDHAGGSGGSPLDDSPGEADLLAARIEERFPNADVYISSNLAPQELKDDPRWVASKETADGGYEEKAGVTQAEARAFFEESIEDPNAIRAMAGWFGNSEGGMDEENDDPDFLDSFDKNEEPEPVTSALIAHLPGEHDQTDHAGGTGGERTLRMSREVRGAMKDALYGLTDQPGMLNDDIRDMADELIHKLSTGEGDKVRMSRQELGLVLDAMAEARDPYGEDPSDLELRLSDLRWQWDKDKGGGVTASAEGVIDLTDQRPLREALVAHLEGQHDQKDHGSGGGGSSSRDAVGKFQEAARERDFSVKGGSATKEKNGYYAKVTTRPSPEGRKYVAELGSEVTRGFAPIREEFDNQTGALAWADAELRGLAEQGAAPKMPHTREPGTTASLKDRVDNLEASYLREEAKAVVAHLEGQHDQKDHAGGGGGGGELTNDEASRSGMEGTLPDHKMWGPTDRGNWTGPPPEPMQSGEGVEELGGAYLSSKELDAGPDVKVPTKWEGNDDAANLKAGSLDVFYPDSGGTVVLPTEAGKIPGGGWSEMEDGRVLSEAAWKFAERVPPAIVREEYEGQSGGGDRPSTVFWGGGPTPPIVTSSGDGLTAHLEGQHDQKDHGGGGGGGDKGQGAKFDASKMTSQYAPQLAKTLKEFDKLGLEASPIDIASAVADDLLGGGRISEDEVDLAIHIMSEDVARALKRP